MKTKITIILTAITCMTINIKAQGLYIGAGAGYGFSMASQNLSVNFDGKLNDKTYEIVKGSYGKGLNFGADVGYMLNKNIGVELGISYLVGSKFESTSTKELSYTDKLTVSGKMLRLIPGLLITTGENKIKPYARIGLVVGMAGKIIQQETDLNIQTNTETAYTWEYTGGVALGFSSALGINYSINDKLSLFGEFRMINQSWAPTKGTMVKYTTDGVDQLATFNTDQKEINYVNSYTESSSSPTSSAEPSIQLKKYSPFSSWGINFGIRFSFGSK